MKVSKTEYRAIEKLVKRCMRHLMKKDYELGIPKGAQHHIPLEVFKTKKGGGSRGGELGIHINVNHWQFGNPKHTEYKSYTKDPVIGTISTSCEEDHMLIVVAHEIAHYVQYKYAYRSYRFKGKWQKPHGEAFRMIYRYLRRDLVNPIITERRTILV